MGQTSECIEWGVDHGYDGKGAIPNFTERLGAYSLPYIDGYRIGFIRRKAEEMSRDRGEIILQITLEHLMLRPRYSKSTDTFIF